MPRRSIDDIVESTLDKQHLERHIELRVDLVDEMTGRVLFTAGGVWDRRLKRYIGEARKSRVLRLHPGQLEVGDWLAEWLTTHQRGGVMTHEDGRRIWSILLLGGRRGGKSDISFKLAITFAVMVPKAIVWVVCPGFPDVPEVERELEEILPITWYDKVGRPDYRYTLANGSQVFLKSQDDPELVKRGRCDLAIMNEGQKQHEATFGILRPAASDRRGLVVITANPPKKAKGQWIAEYAQHDSEKCRVDEFGNKEPFHGKMFRLDPRLNPHVSNDSLLDMKGEVSDREYRIEILGEILGSEDAVLHAWSEHNIAPAPDISSDITPRFCRQRFGAPYERVVAMDFQRVPHMAAVSGLIHVDPAKPSNSLLWIDTEIIIPQGSENDICDAMDRLKWNPDLTAIVVDASSGWQDVDRKRGRTSWDVLHKRGWRNLYKPDELMERNPLVEDRVLVSNARICDANGTRHVLVDPRCRHLIQAIQKWENRNGKPSRTAVWAHICDCITYLIYRLYPRRLQDDKVEIWRLPRPAVSANWETLHGQSVLGYESDERDED